MKDIWDYYESIDRRFEYAEKLAGKVRFYGADLRKALLERLVYGTDLTMDGGVVTATWRLNEPAGILRLMTHDSGRTIIFPDYTQVYAVVEKLLVTPKRLNIPEVASVRWACPAPTDPVPEDYPTGSYGWLMMEYERRMTPQMREHNRRIAQESADLMDRYARLWGFKKP